jgi:glycosyltransferase involved in cell wall biosynthesis
MIFLYLLVALLAFYLLFLLYILIGTFQIQHGKTGSKNLWNISIIVAARNEEKNVISLLECLVKQNYPAERYEIIAVNDRSTDKTDFILKEYSKKYSNIRYIRIDHCEKDLIGKKNALTRGIEKAKGDVLLFTDADCLPWKNWVKSINDQFNAGADVVVGYSPLLKDEKRIFQRLIFTLKKLERLSIFTVSAGTIGWNWGVTATGRNFAYKKKVFKEVRGFSGIGAIPSGDDDLFLQKISKSGRYKISFVLDCDSFVPSLERENVRAQYNQEKRRASKWRFYPLNIKIFSSLIFLFYLLLLIAFIMALFIRFPWSEFLLIFILKILIDFLVVFRGAVLFKEKRLLGVFPLAEIFYIPYFLIFGILGTFSRYNWR